MVLAKNTTSASKLHACANRRCWVTSMPILSRSDERTYCIACVHESYPSHNGKLTFHSELGLSLVSGPLHVELAWILSTQILCLVSGPAHRARLAGLTAYEEVARMCCMPRKSSRFKDSLNAHGVARIL